ncbi:MAG: carboxypeptidase-like regulatory domain-containing protein, partial [Bacteroidia bacterium]|nr:carboxypeptidase-like regulatory domain-containing protein [Bacteroidia bacterium]
MKKNNRHKHYLLSLVFCLLTTALPLQAHVPAFVRGMVVDSISGEPVSFASVQYENTSIGTATDIDGHFSLKYLPEYKRIKISSVGFQSKTEILDSIGVGKTLIIRLNPSTIGLNEVVVKSTTRRYSRKNNPAVELIKQVIAHKEQNRMKNTSKLQYEQYDKLTLYWDNFQMNNQLLKNNFGFIENHL